VRADDGLVIDQAGPTSRVNGSDRAAPDELMLDERLEHLGLERLREPARKGPKAPPRSVIARISTAHFLMVLFGLTGFGLTLFLLQENEATVPIAVSTGKLPAGTALTTANFDVVDVEADSPVAATAMSPGEITDAMSLSAPVDAGAPILRSLVSEESELDDLNSLSIPIDDERALGGELTAGDRVHLIGVIEVGTGANATAISTYVATDVPVLSDREQKSGTFGASLSDYFVAVGLDAEQSLSAQTAMMIGRLEVVGAGDAPVDMTKASVSTTGGVTIVNREDVAGYLAAAKAELEQ
jgi:hypothetical protein